VVGVRRRGSEAQISGQGTGAFTTDSASSSTTTTAPIRRWSVVQIDGALGLTITETDCNDIITADVMTAADLDYSRADESRVIRQAPSGTVIGALVI